MLHPAPIDDALPEIELLQATLALKNHFLSLIVKDIYENTGQQLSAVRVQLALLESKAPVALTAAVRDAGKLVGQTMADLKAMSRYFFPENTLNTGANFVAALTTEINRFNDGDKETIITLKGKAFDMKPEEAVLVFSGTLKILALLKSRRAGISAFEISYTKTRLQLTVNYEGEPITANILSQISSPVFKVNHSGEKQVPACIMLSFNNAGQLLNDLG